MRERGRVRGNLIEKFLFIARLSVMGWLDDKEALLPSILIFRVMFYFEEIQLPGQ